MLNVKENIKIVTFSFDFGNISFLGNLNVGFGFLIFDGLLKNRKDKIKKLFILMLRTLTFHDFGLNYALMEHFGLIKSDVGTIVIDK